MLVDFNYISPELRKIKERGARISHRCSIPLGCSELFEGYVSPYVDWSKGVYGGAITSNHECIVDHPWGNKASAYAFEKAVAEHKKVIYIGFLHHCFGHILTDDLRKFWFLGTPQAKKLIEDGAEVVYTAVDNIPLPPVAYEIFEMTGVDLSQARLIDKLVRFDVICVPDNCFSVNREETFSPEWAEMIDRIKANAIKNPENIKQLNKSREVYLTRVSFKVGWRTEIGEKEIVRVFEKEGFKIVSPEQLSIREQINLVYNCDRLVTTEGSVAHLAMFCKPGTDVVILCKTNYSNAYQDAINEYADLNVTYIEAHKSVKASKDAPWLGPFYLCVTAYLERYIGHSIPHAPLWIRPSWWRYKRNMLYRSYNRTRKIIKKVVG